MSYSRDCSVFVLCMAKGRYRVRDVGHSHSTVPSLIVWWIEYLRKWGAELLQDSLSTMQSLIAW